MDQDKNERTIVNETQEPVAIDLGPIESSQKLAPHNNPYLVPLSIIIAGILITGGIIYTKGAPRAAQNIQEDNFGNTLSASAANIRLPDNTDHVRGNPNAPVTIIEFSDFQCPFCEQLHPTLARILEEYPGEVKWVYRHFPLATIHPEATASAVASECVAKLAGNDAFWRFIDDIFVNQNQLGTELYNSLGEKFNISQKDLKACMESKEAADKVMEDLIDATESGGQGTPYVIVLNKNGKPFPFSGALPYNQVKLVVEQALNSK